jgi:hypothetical protein
MAGGKNQRLLVVAAAAIIFSQDQVGIIQQKDMELNRFFPGIIVRKKLLGNRFRKSFSYLQKNISIVKHYLEILNIIMPQDKSKPLSFYTGQARLL